MRNLLGESCTARLARDNGVAGLVIAMIIAVVAFTALTVVFSQSLGPARDLARLLAGNKNSNTALDAVMVNYVQNLTVVCPDTTNDGNADSPCTAGSGARSGRLPWRTLGLNEDAAVDAYGRWYKYTVAAPASEQAFCVSVANDFGGSAEYTGDMTPPASLEIRQTGSSSGYFVPFAILSHGKNGFGGVQQGSTTVISGAAGSESTNATADSALLYSGPYSDSSSPFDDELFAPKQSELQNICEDRSPGGEMNATLGDDFNASGSTFDAAKWTAAGGSPPTRADGQAVFSGAGGYLTTLATANFAPSTRAVYISAVWTPAANGNSFDIVTRGTPGATATNGLTFTFGSNVDITNDDGLAVTAVALTVTANRRYLLEVYDNGDDVWLRATQLDDPAVTASVRASNVTADLSGTQRVIFANGTGTNRLDDVLIGFPMLSLETATGTPATGVVGDGSSTADMTLEAWVRPHVVTGTGTIVAQWDTSNAANSSFRLYHSAGAVRFAVRDTAENAADVSTGIALTANTWTHIAVSFNGTSRVVTAYENGRYVSATTTALTAGIHAATEAIGFGADSVGTVAANNFDGQMADVRIWESVRTASQIVSCYNRRSCATTNMAGWWTMDPRADAGGFETSGVPASVGTALTRTTAIFTPSMSVLFRPTSADLCSSNQSGAYQCDFRAAATETVVSLGALNSIYAKVWGGGGGGYTGTVTDQPGGGGGYGEGLIPNTAGQIRVTIGAGGSGTSDPMLSGTTGDASAVDYTATDLILANGGIGGASANPGNQGAASFPEGSAINTQAAPSVADEDGAACIPAADPCEDPHYNAIGNDNTARGGAAGNNAGQTGVVILFW